MSSGNSLALPYFCILSHKRQEFRENVIEHKMCVGISSTTFSETFLIIRRNERDAIIHVHWSSCKLTRRFCQISIKLEFSRNIFEQLSNNKFH